MPLLRLADHTADHSPRDHLLKNIKQQISLIIAKRKIHKIIYPTKILKIVKFPLASQIFQNRVLLRNRHNFENFQILFFAFFEFDFRFEFVSKNLEVYFQNRLEFIFVYFFCDGGFCAHRDETFVVCHVENDVAEAFGGDVGDFVLESEFAESFERNPEHLFVVGNVKIFIFLFFF